MYGYNQIVHNLDTNEPEYAYTANPEGKYVRDMHYIRATETGYEIALPKSIDDAKQLLRKGIIVPAPAAVTHHWRCQHWIERHNAGRCACEQIIKESPHLGNE